MFEKNMLILTQQGFIEGSIHFYIGQEAISAGVCYCLKKTDYIVSNHRSHGHLISKGGNLNKMIAELMGRETGYCRGRGGTMHLMDAEIGMMGANGIVGSGIPISVGLGNACKDFEKDKIVVSFFGDGAINTGAFHESLNLAAAWGLPIIFVCENNKYAISTDVQAATAVEDLSDRAKAYGINGYSIDGNDVFKVIQTTRKGIKTIREEGKPSLIVCNTYRQLGHSIHDPRPYRTKSEEELWKKRDPIDILEALLVKQNILNEEKIKEIGKEIQAEINSAIKFAKDSPKPDIKDLCKGVTAS